MSALNNFRKVASIILLVLAALTLIFNIAFCVYGIYDTLREMKVISETPGSSGVDYWGLGWGYAYFSFFISLFGLIVSVIAHISAKIQAIKDLSAIIIFYFSCLLLAALLLPVLMFSL